MERLERLVNLVAALLDAEHPLTRSQLRERVGGYSDDPDAFRRNFERDKDLLRQMGLPLVTETLEADRSDDQAGYRIPRERYELPDPGLDEDELAALRLAASAVGVQGAWGRHASKTALRKLAGAPTLTPAGSPAPHPPSAPVATEVAELSAGDTVAVAFGAVAERRQLRFTYRGRPRLVDPWHLSYRKGQWYLAGLDRGRDEERMYRLDRVEGAAEAVGEPGAFDRPAGRAVAPPPPWLLGDNPAVQVELLVDPSHAAWAELTLGAGTLVARDDDGSVRFTVTVTNLDAFRSFVLGFLDHAEITGPPEARASMTRWLTDLIEAAPAPPDPLGAVGPEGP